MTPRLYWALYDATVRRMAKEMRVSEDRVRELALRKMTDKTVNDPHKWLKALRTEWQVEQRYPARWSYMH